MIFAIDQSPVAFSSGTPPFVATVAVTAWQATIQRHGLGTLPLSPDRAKTFGQVSRRGLFLVTKWREWSRRHRARRRFVRRLASHAPTSYHIGSSAPNETQYKVGQARTQPRFRTARNRDHVGPEVVAYTTVGGNPRTVCPVPRATLRHIQHGIMC